MYCPNCGMMLPEGADFCPDCGTGVSGHGGAPRRAEASAMPEDGRLRHNILLISFLLNLIVTFALGFAVDLVVCTAILMIIYGRRGHYGKNTAAEVLVGSAVGLLMGIMLQAVYLW
ncbi:hypothetical protein AUQ37_03620 [Candidatus Methanomethylophilus sp. 1R26]|uniref:zinc ribbon domain-containing protein n=1 Tax=Candidatus Methanomethylophilus sp. 1R26 TaxID=1769296 RepID=UPI0007374896|nr:zinc ribbon domain-containing protein [Candidatus Methanomethylophilus sp. 1R26]KUE73194.1 hypothetical protein AUQ37_03620 [Candidatus Methanomethylophilus sp. 1R26]